MANWFSYVEVAAAALAGAAWYLFPELGAWPLALGLAPWVVRLAATGRAGRMTRFAPPLFLFLIMAVGGVWAAYDPAAAWAKFWLIVGAILLFYAFAHGLLAAHADEGRSGEAYAWMLALMGATVTVYFLATHDWGQFTAELAFVPELGRRLQAPLPPLPGHRLNPNVVGGLLAMSIPFAGLAFCLAWARRRWRRAAAAMALLGLALFGLLMTTSLGAWLGLAAALVLAGVWTLAGWWVRPRRRRWLVLGAMVVVVLLAIGVALLRPEAVVAAAGPLPGTGGIGRLSMYRSALPLVADYPFVGGGLNGFDMLYSTYAFLTHVGFIPHAHNVYLNVAIEQGLPALFALGWMWGLAVVAGWRDAADGRVRPLLGVGLLALVTMAVHGLVDDAFYGSRALLLLFVPLAFVLPFPSARAVDRKRWASVVVATGVGLTLLAAVLLWRPLLSLAYGNLAAVQQSRAELSVYEWPEWPIQDAVRREVDLSRPVANFERALSLNPENGPAGRRLGQIELSLGEYGAALEHLRRAYRQMPWDNGTRQLYGEALIVTGSVEEGATLWDGVWATQGQLDGRVYWYRHIGDIERLEAVQAAAEQAE
ncbi:MAG: O-antigen ligase family protein [Candidatus Promineifilaceae bacterium]|nr:O-antigen ligase family protein [Candidatus Promineifilaceae bacterium]